MKIPNITDGQIEMAIQRTKDEVVAATKKHGVRAFISNHEALGVLLEEFDEVREAVHHNKRIELANELAQVAAVAIMAIASLKARGEI